MQVPAPFDYERLATSVEHAIGLLARLGPSARLVAGGHSLLPMMKLRLAHFEYLVDINDLHRELGYVQVDANPRPDEAAQRSGAGRKPANAGEIRIGAMTRHRALLESAAAAATRSRSSTTPSG